MKKRGGREKPKATHAESQPASMRAGWLRETVNEVSTVWASTSMYGLCPPTASASFVVRNPRESAFEALLLSDVFAVFGTKLTPLDLSRLSLSCRAGASVTSNAAIWSVAVPLP